MTQTATAVLSPTPELGTFATPDAIQIMRGRSFRPLHPKHPTNDYGIDYIAHSQALQCRWNGGTHDLSTGDPVFYSVAQHACIVSDLTKTFYGLMHDASEAFLCDIPRPLKPYLTGYYAYEEALMKEIITRHGVPYTPEIVQRVKAIDNAMIYWERDAMIGLPPEPYANEKFDHPGNTIFDVVPDFKPWSPKRAKWEFLDRYQRFAA